MTFIKNDLSQDFRLITLSTAFDVYGNSDEIHIVHKDGMSFPYKIKQNKNNEFVLSQGSQGRVYLKVKYIQIKKALTIKELVEVIVKRYNKTTAFMPSRSKI